MKVLLAIGDPIYSSYLHEDFERNDMDVVNTEIMHIKYIDEVLTLEQPDVLFFNDQRIGIETKDIDNRERAILEKIRKIRLEFADLRIVILTERDNNDTFLRNLVAWGVYDIFNSNRIKMESLIAQIKEPASLTNVQHILYQDDIELELGDIPVTADIEVISLEENTGVKEVNPNEEKNLNKKPKKNSVEQNNTRNTEKESQHNPTIVEKNKYTISFQQVVSETVTITIPRKTIVIANVNSRSGSTFISHLLCDFLNEQGIDVNYIENIYDEGYTFPRFNGHKMAPEGYRSYFSYLKFIEENRNNLLVQPPPIWRRNKTNLLVKNSLLEIEKYTGNEEDAKHIMQIIYAHQHAPLSIFDVGSDWDKDAYRELLDMADYVFFVVEPDLVHMMQKAHGKSNKTRRFLSYLLRENTLLIGNRFSSNLEKKPLIQESYGGKLVATFCDYFSEDVFDSQLEHETVFAQDKYRKEIEKEFVLMSELLLPREWKTSSKKKQGNLFNRFRIRKLES